MNNLKLFTDGTEAIREKYAVLGLPYVYKFGEKAEGGKEITISCGMHGNEALGLIAGSVMFKVAAVLDEEGLLPKGYVLNIVLANPEASEQGTRGIMEWVDGKLVMIDANREFNNPDPQTETAKRIASLKRFYAVDIMLCLHNPQENIPENIASTLLSQLDDPKKSDKTTMSFAIAHGLTAEREELLAEVGMDACISGPGLTLGKSGPTDSDEYTASQGGFGVTIEVGGNEKENDVERCCLGITRMLAKAGVFPKFEDYLAQLVIEMAGGNPDDEPPGAGEYLGLQATDQILKGRDFAFIKCYNNFDWIAAGTVIAISDGQEVRAQSDCFILFPKKNPNLVSEGQQMALLVYPTIKAQKSKAA